MTPVLDNRTTETSFRLLDIIRLLSFDCRLALPYCRFRITFLVSIQLGFELGLELGLELGFRFTL